MGAAQYRGLRHHHSAERFEDRLSAAGRRRAGQFRNPEAGEFLTRPALLERALQQAPAGWRDKNLQILFRVEVVRDSVGVPTITATYVW